MADPVALAPGRVHAPFRARRGSGAPLGLIVLIVILVLLHGALLFVNAASIGTILLTFVLTGIIVFAGFRLAPGQYASWFPTAIAAGFVAKLVASGGRYWVLGNLYGGVGDAGGYHNDGLILADVWRSLKVPEFGTGTDVIGPITGLLYVPYEPTLLGGFFIFATLAFVGQMFMVAAFRYVANERQFRWYLAALLFLPTVAYWPSSIGKESLMFLFMGPVTYGAARLFKDFRFRWMAPIGVGLFGAGAVRAHIALLLAGALIATVVVARAPQVAAAGTKRLILLGASALVLVGAIFATSQRFYLDLSAGISSDVLTDEIDPFLSEVSDRTDAGGSAVEGGVISSPGEIPEATLRVLFRPLPWEATSVQTLAASLEGGLLLTFFVLRLPAVLKGIFRIRRQPYALFSLVFTAGFIFGFSAILNLGILARQRSQVIPFLLAFLILTGFKEKQAQATIHEGRQDRELALAH